MYLAPSDTPPTIPHGFNLLGWLWTNPRFETWSRLKFIVPLEGVFGSITSLTCVDNRATLNLSKKKN